MLSSSKKLELASLIDKNISLLHKIIMYTNYTKPFRVSRPRHAYVNFKTAVVKYIIECQKASKDSNYCKIVTLFSFNPYLYLASSISLFGLIGFSSSFIFLYLLLFLTYYYRSKRPGFSQAL